MRPSASRVWCAGLGVLCWLLLTSSALGQSQPAATPASVIDGPTAGLPAPTGLGLSIARDGTGGAVYLKQAGGVAHVFLSRLTGGSFQPPVEIDPGLAGASSQPVIAAGNGGLLLVGFINGSELYVSQALTGDAALGAPQPLAAGAVNPAISISNYGKAYLAFALADGSGADVRAAFFSQGQWALEPAPLNITPGDDAGTGPGRPAVVAAGDGVGIVAWGEGGAVYTRRVWGSLPSTVTEQADGPLPGCAELAADQPAVAAGGDSSYVEVAFHEQLSCSGQTRSRVLMNRLRGSAYDGLTQPDGLQGGGDSAGNPKVAMGEYGGGLVTSERAASHALVATDLGDKGLAGGNYQVNSGPQAAAPQAVPAMAGLFTRLVAWQQDPGSSGPPEIRLRYAPGPDPLGPEQVISSPTHGPTNAAAGVAADGDSTGDAAVVWVQGTGSTGQIMAAQLYQPPGPFFLPGGRQYVRTALPTLTWTAPREPWGPLTFALTIDGGQPIQTGATSAQPPSPLSDGPHSYQVTATNPAGQQSQTGVGHVFVDTVTPAAALTLSGAKRTGDRILAHLRYADLPPLGSPAGDASGLAVVTLQWGDGTTVSLGRHVRKVAHVYLRRGRFTVTLTVTDRAGNVTQVRVRVKIVKPKPKPKPGPPVKPHR